LTGSLCQIEHNVGVNFTKLYELKEVSDDFFDEVPDERVRLSDLRGMDVPAFEAGEKVILVIHAMQMMDDMKRQYRKQRRRR